MTLERNCIEALGLCALRAQSQVDGFKSRCLYNIQSVRPSFLFYLDHGFDNGCTPYSAYGKSMEVNLYFEIAGGLGVL